MSPSAELLDEAGAQVGTVAEASVHTSATPLHLAFSAYVIDPEGQGLVGRRARWKSTWPGVWTNSCSGHPCPGEKLPEAVARRVDEVLGIIPADITLILPDFRCRTRDPHKYVGRQYRTSLCSSGGYTVDDSPSTVVPANWSIARCSPCIGTG